MKQARRTLLATLALSISVAAASLPFSQARADEAPKSIRIGWTLGVTGPSSGGVAATTLPNYRLWVKQVNDAGGIMLKAYGKRVPIEVVEYDDRSSSEETVRNTERLITQDKVDFILPPWGTAYHLAVAPIYAKHGYPLVGVTANTDKAPEVAKRWKNVFFFMGTGSEYGGALLDLLEQGRKEGKIGNKIALINVAEGFGVEMAAGARRVIAKTDFELVYDKSYPLGTQDLSPVVNEIKKLNPDVVIAFSLPQDTFLLTEQAAVAGLNPKVMYLGVGSAFPIYKKKYGDKIEGIMGPGGVDFDRERMKAYFQAHTELNGYEPDRFASTISYAALEVLQQAIERVGKIDRAAVTEEIRNGTFDTILGTIQLTDQRLLNTWRVGQWQDGEFYGIGPADKPGAKAPIWEKPSWK